MPAPAQTDLDRDLRAAPYFRDRRTGKQSPEPACRAASPVESKKTSHDKTPHIALLHVNMLLALLDTTHVHHGPASRLFHHTHSYS
ncbi:MAG: hypothetical protein KGS60_18150 [Verrucomicrobia bacterium]|nr:hypothetical protein [Verrucomicrobiota bacterium]